MLCDVWLLVMVCGEVIGVIVMIEFGVGSDFKVICICVECCGDYYVLNG